MTTSWKTYAADRAFERSRRRAQWRLFKSAIIGSRKRGEYSTVRANEEYTVSIADIEMLDVEGRVVPLPPLPITLTSSWAQAYEEWGRVEGCHEAFSTRIEGGRIILEGGMRELMRLELQREHGETNVVAVMKPSRVSIQSIERVEDFELPSECCEQEAC
jgi:hypothetical protein